MFFAWPFLRYGEMDLNVTMKCMLMFVREEYFQMLYQLLY